MVDRPLGVVKRHSTTQRNFNVGRVASNLSTSYPLHFIAGVEKIVIMPIVEAQMTAYSTLRIPSILVSL
jgi:hypothetical protein